MLHDKQQNIKVHFAGCEITTAADIHVQCAKLKYGLFTCLPYLGERVGIKTVTFHNYGTRGIKYLEDKMEHVIMDSGLFSLMFGAHAAPRDEKFISTWTDLIIDFVLENNLGVTVVEVDSQKLLGADETWKFRERMRDRLPNKMINVFHLEDGQKGLDRLIEFSEYIAVSLPELRKTGKKDYAVRLVNYIKNKKPSIDIHLLGCTENKLLRDLRFCTSADSTAWQAVNRWGQISYNNNEKTRKVKTSLIDPKTLDQFEPQVKETLARWNIEPTENWIYYYKKFALAGVITKKQYEVHAGPQD